MMRTLVRGALAGAVPALPVLVGAALVGAASGLRSQTGLAAVALTTPAVHVSRPVALLSGHRGSVGAATAAVGEIVADKFPGIPSRLSPAGVTSRVLLGALAAAALAAAAARDPEPLDAVPAPVPVPAPVAGGPRDAWFSEDAYPAPAGQDPAVVAVAATLGAVASVATTFAGAWWRRAQSRHRPDWPGAVLEDSVAVGLAWAGCAVAT
ncbi:DUF4126 family protein [Streptomyces sp. CA-111067]|uniref:DUF4126 family protein n=1 Tax=Streptomyces sp. CA-111067 TaxID=3240046 RepID=UPI003D974838